MPQIKPYEAGVIGPNPTETGVQAAAATARRVGAFFNQQASATELLAHHVESLGAFEGHLLADTGRRFGSAIEVAGDQAVKYLDHQQISAGSATWTRLLDQKTKEWNATAKNADPNDPTVAQKFMENSVEPDLQKFAEQGFYTENGQKWAEAHVASMRKHFSDTTSGDMSRLAAQAARVNHEQTVNSLSNTVRNDPSSLDYTLAALESTTESKLRSSPNLTGVEYSHVRTELMQKGKDAIVKSAAFGWIEKTGKVPDWVKDEKYSPYVNGAELKQFEQAARGFQRMERAEQRAAREEIKANAKGDFNQKVNQLEASTMPQNVGDRPQLPNNYWEKMRILATHPGAEYEPGRLASMVRQGEVLTDRLNKPEPLGRVSHETTMGLLGRMRAADDTRLNDNGPIYDAYQANKLSTADFNFLNREFQSLRSPDGVALEKDRGQFVKSFARLIDGQMNDAGIHSVLGTQRMYEFEMDARRQEGDLRKKGLDPHLAYDPRSEYFFGKPENIAKYRVSLQEAQKYDATLKAMDKASTEGPKVGERKQFKQGWGVWNGKTWAPE